MTASGAPFRCGSGPDWRGKVRGDLRIVDSWAVDTTLRDPLIGQVIDRRYRVDQRIAVGGMATVYRATDTRLDRVVALKVMHPALAEDEAFTGRFIREARSAARLDHPNVVGVLDQGTDGSCVYLAMEYVAGCTLRDVLSDCGALQPRAALDVLEPLLAGLGAAHRAGLVHRDVKPENVLIGDDGRVKVADFGLVHGADGHTSVRTDALLGTVSYLAPEQIERGTADARTDVYACGVLLYEMLTGARPHDADTAAQVLYARVREDVPPPSRVAGGLAPELDGLVARAAARDPRRRPENAAALLSLVRAARAALTDAQLDAPAPGSSRARRASPAPGAVGAEDRTRVVPLPAGARTDPTARIELPPGLPPGGLLLPGIGRDDGSAFDGAAPPEPRQRLSRRGLLTLLAGAVLLLAVGTAVWYINSGQFLRMPGVYDMSRAEATETLRDAGLQVRTEEDYSRTVSAGHVIRTDPERGERVRRNATVTITVSLGPETAEVPNLRGLALTEARQQLEEAGLTPGEETRAFSEEVPRGSVIETDPEPGTEMRPGMAVDLVVSRGAKTTVPDVTGLGENAAVRTLTEAGFRTRTAEERVHSAADAGTVARQSPGAGEVAGEGEVITLTLSKGPEMIVVPDVTGMTEDEAVDTLEDAGFKANVIQVFVTGTVFSQSVDPGDRAARGSTITIWVR